MQREKSVHQTSFIAAIIKDLARLAHDMPMPDSTHNTGKMLAIAYFWDIVGKHAKRQSDQMWELLMTEGLVEEPSAPGEHVLCESPKFVCYAKVTNKIKRFSPEELSKIFKRSKYKVPELITREYVERAKKETKSAISYSIEER
jgi:hypothetical protein